MRKFIDKVTITGADNSVDPQDLVELSKEFSFVEWGILLSKASEGLNRFPDYNWLKNLKKVWEENESLILSGHLCGKWVREICLGNWSVLEDRPDVIDMFSRFQLNFHAQVHDIDVNKFLNGLEEERLWFIELIFQLDDVNNKILDLAVDNEIEAYGLFDVSGGNGILPENWPTSKNYCGYAGGLSPENLTEQLELIEKVAPNVIWIDVETHVRSNEDKQFDLNKVRNFLEASRDWVIN